jgi:hypothetical protein
VAEADDVFGPITKAVPAVQQSSDPQTRTIGANSTAPPFSAMNSWGPTPEMTSGMTFGEIGQSGLRAFSGWVKEEFLTELQGKQGVRAYREMQDNSPIVGAVLFAIISTMRKVDWRVIPNEDAPDSGGAQQAADFVQSCMDDMSHSWEDLVVENLSMLGYGYAVHEIVYKQRIGRNPRGKDKAGLALPGSNYDDGLVGWRRIPIRGQDTILKWFFDAYGGVTGVTQQPWTGQLIDLPIEKMLLFRASQHKNNPEGRSVLRTAYIPYYFVKRLQEQEAIMGERMGGFPVISVPSILIESAKNGDANAQAALTSFKKMAVNLRIDEQMGALIPSDMWPGTNGASTARMYSIELVTPAGGGRGSAMNFEQAIVRYNTSIMTSVLADFLTLGHEARGTQSLAVTKVDLFFQAIEGFLNSNAAVYNRYAVSRLWELNGFDPDYMPKIEPDLAQRVDLDVLSNFVLRLSQAGMPLFPNEELQTFLLDAGGLPDVSDPRALQAAGLMDEQLDTADDKEQAQLDAMLNPQPAKATPQPGGMSKIEKIVLASLARRMIRKQGPRFNIGKHRSF